jgi:hypothetical protein
MLWDGLEAFCAFSEDRLAPQVETARADQALPIDAALTADDATPALDARHRAWPLRRQRGGTPSGIDEIVGQIRTRSDMACVCRRSLTKKRKAGE